MATEQDNPPGGSAAIYGFLGLFAVLLAVVTCRHELYLDEAQAWLIARDSRNLLELIGHLRYEGHPALWYLLIYPPSHLFSHMAWMQVINYVLAIGMAWLVLSERRLPLAMRVLTVFSVPLFFYMGVVARSYMLAGVLLLAAVRCLLAERRHWQAMVLLGLAINSHFLAIPVAAGIFVWLYWLAPVPSWSVAAGKLKERRFWVSAAILGVALAVCYFTLRPAPDLYTPQYQWAGTTTLDDLFPEIGGMLTSFAPLHSKLASLPRQGHIPWTYASLLATFRTGGLWLLAASALSARRSRWFMVSVWLVWTATVWATVHVALPIHVTFLFVCFVIALILNTPDAGDGRWIPPNMPSLRS